MHACRYRLLPYLYTLFLHANATGTAVMRPLFYEFPAEERLFEVDTSFMLGEFMLLSELMHMTHACRPIFNPCRGCRAHGAAAGGGRVGAGGCMALPGASLLAACAMWLNRGSTQPGLSRCSPA